jgi:phosphomannomutase
MAAIMANLRKLSPGDELAGSTIEGIQDLLDGKQTVFPPSDVLIIRFSCGDKLVVRPSGTEPKIKYYLFFTMEGGKCEANERKLASRIQTYKAALS